MFPRLHIPEIAPIRQVRKQRRIIRRLQDLSHLRTLWRPAWRSMQSHQIALFVLAASMLAPVIADGTGDAADACAAPADCATGWFCVASQCMDRRSFVETWGGGDVGATGVALAVTASGERLIAAVAGRELRLYRQEDAASDWDSETIDHFATAPQLAVDANRGLHVAYREAGSSRVKYAYQLADRWITEVVDQGFNPSLAVGPDGRAYLAYSAAVGTGSAIKLAEQTDSNWSIETIDSGGGSMCPCIGDPTSLCPCGIEPGQPYLDVGTDGLVHVVSPRWSTEYAGLDYRVRAENDWPREAIEPSGFIEGATAVALGANGEVYAAYAVLGDLLRVATRISGSWSYVDTGLATGGQTSLVSSDAGLHLCGFSPSLRPNALYYATNVSGDWQQTLVDEQADDANFCSLALDAQGAVHIAYESGETGALMIADNRTGDFEKETVAEGIIYTGRIAYGVDANGKGHLAAPRRVFMRELEQAWNHGSRADYWTDASGTPMREVVTTEALIFPGIAMTLDQQGFAHLSFKQGWTVPTASAYATNAKAGADGGWWREVIVDHYDISGTAIATNSSDLARIAYADGSDNDIKLAAFDGETWQHEQVEARWADMPSLVVDNRDAEHLLYTDGSGVHYAEDSSGTWQISTLSDAWTNYLPATLAMSPNGVLHAAYWRSQTDDRSERGLWYANNASGTWVAEQVQNTQEVSQDVTLRGWNFFSLAGDTNEVAHISFVNEDDQLVHLQRATDGWQARIYDDAERHIEGIWSAIAPDGKLHIAYIADTALYRAQIPTQPLRQLTVRISGNGHVSSVPGGIDCGSDCSEDYPSGSEVTLTATPDDGASFTGWGGACAGTADCTLIVDSALSVTANFTKTTPSVTTIYLSLDDDERELTGITGTTSRYLDFGGNDTFTISPDVVGPIKLVDNQTSTIILPVGLVIEGSDFASDGLRFTINGHPVTLLGAVSDFSFAFGGEAAVTRDYAETATAFGASIPNAGAEPVSGTVVGAIASDGSIIP